MQHSLLVVAAWVGTAFAADATALLPDTIAAPGGVVATAPAEHYVSNGLYEYLDGGADVYIDAGMITCTVREYRGLKNRAAEYEIALYDMRTPLYAFGLFRQLHESRARSIGTESAAEPLRVSFWKSRWYAEVLDKSSKPAADSTLTFVAKTVAGRLAGDTLLPVEIRLLPDVEKVAGSEQYRKGGFLSRSFLNNVISAQYPCAAGACTLFVVTCPSDSAAAGTFAAIGREYGGGKPRVQAALSGARIEGCVGCTSEEFGQKWPRGMLKQMSVPR